jgi:hypothetical protein
MRERNQQNLCPFRILGDGGSLVILTVLFLRFAQFLQTEFSILPPIGQCHFRTLSYSSFILLFGFTQSRMLTAS